jgi:hypothetical protein
MKKHKLEPELIQETANTGTAHYRVTRLQIVLSLEELRALDDFRFRYRMPSRAAAFRELLKRGLAG